MTVRENEENGNSSNTKMADIKKKNIEDQEQEQEQDINLQIGTSNSQKQIEIDPINEELERSPKRAKNTESNEAESSKKNEQESDSDSDSDSDSSLFNYLGQDPLSVTEQILLQYYNFVVYVYQILRNDEEKQDWSEIVERVKRLAKTLDRDLRVVASDMETLLNQDDAEKEYELRKNHIPNILALIRQINTGIASSRTFRLVSDIKNRGKVLPICVGEFERSLRGLSQLIDSIRVLKEIDAKS